MEQEKNTKICCSCKQELPLDNFYRNRSSKDGYSAECKECRKHYQNNRVLKKKSVYGNLNPDLKGFTVNDLIKELGERGWEGTLTCKVQKRVDKIIND